MTVQNAQMFELAFRDAAGQLVPVAGGGVLFDEQTTVPETISQLNSMYFDEIYHARTGYEQLHKMPVYETTHPPLGKDLIMLGIALFGMTGFGWRFSGTLFGVLLVPANRGQQQRQACCWRWISCGFPKAAWRRSTCTARFSSCWEPILCCGTANRC